VYHRQGCGHNGDADRDAHGYDHGYMALGWKGIRWDGMVWSGMKWVDLSGHRNAEAQSSI